MKDHTVIVGSFVALAAFGLALDPGHLSAQVSEIVVTEDDFVEEKVYSPYAGRAYSSPIWYTP